MNDNRKATKAQIEQCVELMNKLEFDLDWLDLDKMSRGQMQRLIDKLKDKEMESGNGARSGFYTSTR